MFVRHGTIVPNIPSTVIVTFFYPKNFTEKLLYIQIECLKLEENNTFIVHRTSISMMSKF